MAKFQLHQRRTVLQALAAAGFAGLVPAASNIVRAQTPLPLTPACPDLDEPTPPQTSGPFYTPNAPQRSSLREAGMEGTPIVLTGLVLNRSCVPLTRVLVELWHADDAGIYDNEGFRLRGHQFTTADGVYRFDTIVPGQYGPRTRHFHARFQAADQPVLTTQFYFPDEPANGADPLFDPALLLTISEEPQTTARYDVVLDVA